MSFAETEIHDHQNSAEKLAVPYSWLRERSVAVGALRTVSNTFACLLYYTEGNGKEGERFVISKR